MRTCVLYAAVRADLSCRAQTHARTSRCGRVCWCCCMLACMMHALVAAAVIGVRRSCRSLSTRCCRLLSHAGKLIHRSIIHRQPECGSIVRATYSCRAHRHACVCTHAVTHTLCSCVLLVCCACMVHAINAAVVTVCVARVLLVEHPCRLPSHSVVAVAVTRAYAHAVNRSTTTEWRMYLFLHAEVHADLLRDAHTPRCARTKRQRKHLMCRRLL